MLYFTMFINKFRKFCK